MKGTHLERDTPWQETRVRWQETLWQSKLWRLRKRVHICMRFLRHHNCTCNIKIHIWNSSIIGPIVCSQISCSALVIWSKLWLTTDHDFVIQLSFFSNKATVSTSIILPSFSNEIQAYTASLLNHLRTLQYTKHCTFQKYQAPSFPGGSFSRSYTYDAMKLPSISTASVVTGVSNASLKSDGYRRRGRRDKKSSLQVRKMLQSGEQVAVADNKFQPCDSEPNAIL